ncbi:MAG: NADH:flavin oxidoreductase, partial [Ketobacteraceae bacterium]|nr:NADH:flavin oxidoreductase [Ketobacteraceae bacterium]
MLADCFTPGRLNGLTLKNRFIKAGTYEGMTPNGQVTESLCAFHERIARGGVAMTTLGYCAVEPDGRLNEDMLYMHEGLRPDLEALISRLHRLDVKVSGQMGYGGGFSKNRDLQRPRPLGPGFGINGLGIGRGMVFCDAMSERDIDHLIGSYGSAARLMKSAGFDALEIHFGHGYGLCQFLSPKTNKRTDAYGGSLKNRLRLPLRVLGAVREAVGEDFPLLGKISMSEGVRGGIDHDNAVIIARHLDRGGLDGIITSGGSSTMNPMLMFRGDSFLKPLLSSEKNWLMKLLLWLYGPRLFRHYGFYENYFLDQASRIRDAVDCQVVYVGGACSNDGFAELMARGFDFIQL